MFTVAICNSFLLESDSSNYQQVLFNEMYLVEEFI